MIARVLMLAAVIAWPLQSLDEAVQQRVQSSRRGALEAPMHAASDLARPLLVVGAVAALAAGPVGRAATLEVAIALVPVNLVVEGMKYATNRVRPNGAHRRTNSSFPSSHTANAFAVATVLARRWRRSAPVGFALALLVGYSRMYLNKHWLIDVVMGAIVGVALACAALEWWSRFQARTRPVPAA